MCSRNLKLKKIQLERIFHLLEDFNFDFYFKIIIGLKPRLIDQL